MWILGAKEMQTCSAMNCAIPLIQKFEILRSGSTTFPSFLTHQISAMEIHANHFGIWFSSTITTISFWFWIGALIWGPIYLVIAWRKGWI